MNNIFVSLNNYIKKNSTFYGDFLNNSKEEILKRDLSHEDLTYYNIIKEGNLNRLYNNTGNNNNFELNINKTKKHYISGIGEVQQLM